MPCHQSHNQHYCTLIRPFQEQKKIFNLQHPNHNKIIPVPKFVTENNIQPRGLATPDGFYNICIKKNNQGGTITYVLAWERSTLYITDIFVSPEYRRQGLGTYLLYLLAVDAKHKRCHTITLDSVLDSDNTFYERLGFKYTQKMDNEMRIKTQDLLANILI